MKNTIKIIVATIFVVWTLIMMSTVVSAQSFNDFVAEVNTTTGIYTNDYQSNVKKAEMLGNPKTTLWDLYSTGTRILAHNTHSEPITEKITTEEVITPQPVTSINIEAKNVVLEPMIVEIPTIITAPQKQVSSLVSGDIILVEKGYKSFTVQNKPNLIINEKRFDLLYDSGLIAPVKNRKWIYIGSTPIITKMGLGDGFILLLFCLMLLLGGAKIIATPKPSPKLADTLYQLSEEKNKVKSLTKEVETLKKENSTLKNELAQEKAKSAKLAK